MKHWARLESSGGTIGGVATFQLSPGGRLATIAGVLSSDTVSAATIPVDDDAGRNRVTGYAVANPGAEAITINVQTYSPDGTAAATLTPFNLPPGCQTAAFFFQDSHANPNFRGSAVLGEQNGKKFSVVALVQNHGLYTAIPVIPAKAPR